VNEILTHAVFLNNNRRRDALLTLADRLGVSVDSARRWVNGSRPIPESRMTAIKMMVENKRMKEQLKKIAAILGPDDVGI
jgi:DNA-binding transcriptional regulator YdaS (Cro superfamily)